MTEKEPSINSINNKLIEYKKNPSLDLRNFLVLHFLFLVKNVLKTIHIPQNSILSSNDLINYGILGLIDAIEKYQPEQNVKFETYAQHRIKGAILDEIRKLDWLSRNERRLAKSFTETMEKSFVESGEAKYEEITKRLNLSDEELRKYFVAFQSSQSSFFIPEIVKLQDEDEEVSFIGNIPNGEEKNALDEIVDNEKIEIIYNFLKSLPERERLIITLYYYENLKFKEIGALLELSESRVSQIHSSIIKKLKLKFKELEG